MKMEKVFVLCVMCMHTRPGGCLHLLLDVQGHGSSCDDGTCLIALYRQCSCVRCSVSHVGHSFFVQSCSGTY